MKPRGLPVRRSMAIAAALAAAGFATAGVYATTLTVSANQDFGGTAELSSCHASSVSIQSADRVFDETSGLWTIPGFTASGIPSGCTGTLYVSAVSTSGERIEEFTVQLDGSPASLHFEFATPQPEGDLGPYAVAVRG